MHLLVQGIVALDEQAVAAINGDGVTEVDAALANLGIAVGLVDLHITATDHAGLFQPGGHYRGVRGLAAARSDQTIGHGYFADVLGHRVLADEDEML